MVMTYVSIVEFVCFGIRIDVLNKPKMFDPKTKWTPEENNNDQVQYLITYLSRNLFKLNIFGI